MRGVAMIIFAGTHAIQLVNPEKKQIMEVPATEAGLAHLIGIGLHPNTLLKAMTALADGLDQPDPTIHNTWRTHTTETLTLDPKTGLIRERFGQTGTGETYHVFYQWGKTVEWHAAVTPEIPQKEAAHTGVLPMPSRIRVVLKTKKAHIQYKARQWRIPDTPFATEWLGAMTSHAGFSRIYPLGVNP